MKIAPTLKTVLDTWLRFPRTKNDELLIGMRTQAASEYDAMLAVARAAKASLCGRVEHPASRLGRALARLERVSRKP